MSRYEGKPRGYEKGRKHESGGSSSPIWGPSPPDLARTSIERAMENSSYGHNKTPNDITTLASTIVHNYRMMIRGDRVGVIGYGQLTPDNFADIQLMKQLKMPLELAKEIAIYIGLPRIVISK